MMEIIGASIWDFGRGGGIEPGAFRPLHERSVQQDATLAELVSERTGHHPFDAHARPDITAVCPGAAGSQRTVG